MRRPRPETGCSGYGHVRARITGRGMKQTRTTFRRQIARRFSFFTPYIIPMRSNLLRRWSAPNLTRQKSQAACILHHAFVGEAFFGLSSALSRYRRNVIVEREMAISCLNGRVQGF